MPYTLEINHINPSADLFFYDTEACNRDHSAEYIKPIVNKHIAKKSWTDNYTFYNHTVSRVQRPTGEWQRITTIKHFVSIDAASEFFADLIADGTTHRTLLREWNQANGILNETNILDDDGNIVEVIHACQARKCLRFGTCPDTDKSCSIIGSIINTSNYPIYHFTPVEHISAKASLKLFSSGQYGLVDLYYRNIWFNTDDEKIALEVQQTFWAKSSTVVFDLTQFKNYSADIIDSDVSLDWSLSPTDLLSPLTRISLFNQDIKKIQTTYTSDTLTNYPVVTLLSKDRQKDLQQEMLFYALLLRKIKWGIKEYTASDQKFIASMRQIFQTEIKFNNIKEKLIQVSGASITGPSCVAVTVLDLLGSKYE